jgi:hypothetical protein
MTARARSVPPMIGLVLLLCVVSGASATWPHSKILFPRDTPVPPLVRAFAWRTIETHCNYLRYELEQRSFWAYDTRATPVSEETLYSIKVLSELPWKKSEPSATIEMTVAVHDGDLRLETLKSSFVVCK